MQLGSSGIFGQIEDHRSRVNKLHNLKTPVLSIFATSREMTNSINKLSMNSILLLVDLTPTAAISSDQAIYIAKYKGAKITLCYIAKTKEEVNSEELKNALSPYHTRLDEAGLTYETHIGVGDYKNEIPAYVKANRPDLVIVGTHGKKGLSQNIFGSHIYDLVKSISATTLVVSDLSTAKSEGFSKILLPVAAHENYLLKVQESCDLLAADGEIIIFNILKSGADVSGHISNNILSTKKLLQEKGIQFKIKNLGSVKFSVGYSKETVDYAIQNEVDLISIMTKVAEHSGGVASDNDKENILLNSTGIAVLSANK